MELMSVPTWNPAGRLMHFPWLSGSGSTVPIYTIGWRILDAADGWTNRFLGFKAGAGKHLRGAAVVMRDAVPDLTNATGITPKKTALTTALSSGSTKAEETKPLFRLGKWLSDQHGFGWEPNIIVKRTHRSLHNLTSASDRDAEVSGAYESCDLQGYDAVLVLDDFVTRGSTFQDISRSIRVHNVEMPVFGFALAKNERRSYAETCGVAVNNTHIPEEWNSLWAEQEATS